METYREEMLRYRSIISDSTAYIRHIKEGIANNKLNLVFSFDEEIRDTGKKAHQSSTGDNVGGILYVDHYTTPITERCRSEYFMEYPNGTPRKIWERHYYTEGSTEELAGLPKLHERTIGPLPAKEVIRIPFDADRYLKESVPDTEKIQTRLHSMISETEKKIEDAYKNIARLEDQIIKLSPEDRISKSPRPTVTRNMRLK